MFTLTGHYNLLCQFFDMRVIIYRKDLLTLRSLSEGFRVVELGSLFCECIIGESEFQILKNYRIWYEKA